MANQGKGLSRSPSAATPRTVPGGRSYAGDNGRYAYRPYNPRVSPARKRMLRRRRRSIVLLVMLLAVGAVATQRVRRLAAATATAAVQPSAGPASAPAQQVPAPGRVLNLTVPRPTAAAPRPATGLLAFAPTAGPVLGTAGTLRRFHVAVEEGQGQKADEFAAGIDRILGDPRSWIASDQVRLQRVPPSADAEFTILLASARTSERLCRTGGLRTGGYTSCRLSGQVIINLDRWQQAVPDYGAPLATYQAYAINHEVGHQLGRGHEACPGVGEPAPVMQQQTYGLKGCLPNPWPYLDGNRYTGPPVA